MSKEQICIVWIFLMIALLIWFNQNRFPVGNFDARGNDPTETIGESKIPLYPGITRLVESHKLDDNLVKMAVNQKNKNPAAEFVGKKTEWFWRFDYVGSQEQVVDFYKRSFETVYVSFSKLNDEAGHPFTVYSLKAESTANCTEDVKWTISILVYDDSIVISHFLFPRNSPIILEAEESTYEKFEQEKAN